MCEGSELADPVSSKIWKLARLGFHEKQREDGISLLIGVPPST